MARLQRNLERCLAHYARKANPRISRQIFLDQIDLRSGTSRVDQLQDAVDRSERLILVVSPEALGSDRVRFEWQGFLTSRPKDLFPVVLADAELPAFLRTLQGVDFGNAEGPLYRQRLAELFGDLLRLSRRIPPPLPDGLELSLAPEPHFTDDETRRLSRALEAAYRQRAETMADGGDVTSLNRTIVGIKRQLRAGPQLQPGDFLFEGRFQLLEVVGKGGFATVWRAYDRDRQTIVAVKVLHPQYSEDLGRRQRFFRGAKQMARLRNPGIVGVVEAECEDGGYYFFVMEYLPGGDFRHAVLKGTLSTEERLRVVLEVGETLSFAHARGVVHRDVKPANIVLDLEGKPKLTDFDLVRAADTTGGTRTGMFGTFLFAAPEAMSKGGHAAEPADLYGLGMTAVFALHGADLDADAHYELASFLDRLDTSEAYRQVLGKALERQVDRRWDSVASFCLALRQAFEPPPAGATPESKPRTTLPRHEPETPFQQPTSARPDMEPEPPQRKPPPSRLFALAWLLAAAVSAGWLSWVGFDRKGRPEAAVASSDSEPPSISVSPHSSGLIMVQGEASTSPLDVSGLESEDRIADRDDPVDRDNLLTSPLGSPPRSPTPFRNAPLASPAASETHGNNRFPNSSIEESEPRIESEQTRHGVTAPNSALLLKVVGLSDDVAIFDTPAGQSTGRFMKPLRPYFVVDDTGDHYGISIAQEDGRLDGFVRKREVAAWNTRKGLRPIPEALPREQRTILAWSSEERIRAFAASRNLDTHGPDLAEEPRDLAGNQDAIPYPLLDTKKIEINGTTRSIHQILIPAIVPVSLETHLNPDQVREVLGAVTLCVVFDASRSMRAHARTFATTLENTLDELSPTPIAVGFILFREPDSRTSRFEVVHPMEVGEAVDWLRRRVRDTFGGPESKVPEPVLDAMTLTETSFLWNSNSAIRGASRVVILVAHQHAALTTQGLARRVPSGRRLEEVSLSLLRNRIRVFALQAENEDRGNLIEVLRSLATETGGEFYRSAPRREDIERQFSERVQRILHQSVNDGLTVANSIQLHQRPGGGTVVALDAITLEMRERLELDIRGLHKPEGRLVLTKAWIFERPELYREEILIDKEMLQDLVSFFTHLSESKLTAGEFETTIATLLEALVGEDLVGDRFGMSIDTEELLAEAVGTEFETNLLSLPLEFVSRLQLEEERRLQENLRVATAALSDFYDFHLRDFEREPSVWMPIFYLP